MRDIETKLLELFSKDQSDDWRWRYSVTDGIKLLLAEPLGSATTEFLTSAQQKKIFKCDEAGDLWLQFELYLKESPENQKQMLQPIEQLIEQILKNSVKTSYTNEELTKEAGTYIMNVNHDVVRLVYLSNNSTFIDLFEKYAPRPPASFFKENSVPEIIKLRDQEAQETIKKVALKTLEPFVLKTQRYIRGKRRQREERNRIENVHAKTLKRRNMTAEELMQDANTPYVPKCESNLSKRIMDAAQKVTAFSTIKHITSSHTLQSVFNDALYGRRTLLDFYMTYNPAALHTCDLLNGDGNVVCLGPQDIDPKASGSIIIEFDLPKLLQTKPSAFYKQKDLEYLVNNKIRKVSLGNTELQFDHTGRVRCADSESAYLTIIDDTSECSSHYANSLKSMFIAYDLERMHQILTLNFFRFMDKMTKSDNTSDQDYIDQFYRKVSQLDDEELVRFLTDIEKNLTDTAEFNFYGAHQINFSTVTSISDRRKNYTLQLPKFLHALNSGELDVLRHARKSLPEVFQSYRFLDYLLTHIKHPEARYYLDDLRKQCQTPNWIQYIPIDTTDAFKIHWDIPKLAKDANEETIPVIERPVSPVENTQTNDDPHSSNLQNPGERVTSSTNQPTQDELGKHNTTLNQIESRSIKLTTEKMQDPATNVKEQVRLLVQIRDALQSLRKEFPWDNSYGTMPHLVTELTMLVAMHTFSLKKSIEIGEYAWIPDGHIQFKKDILSHLKHKDYYAAKKPDSPLYPVHYAVIALVRAFFRIFDVLISFVTGAKQTKNDTPGRIPFFKLPQATTMHHVAKLEKEFEKVIDELDELVKSSATPTSLSLKGK